MYKKYSDINIKDIVSDVIKEINIEIRSSLGEGTTYKIKLPIDRKVKKDE